MDIEVISYASCLPCPWGGLPEDKTDKIKTQIKTLQKLKTFLRTGYATTPGDFKLLELFKEGDEIEQILGEWTPQHFLIADIGLRWFKKKDVVLAYDGAMLEIHSFRSVSGIDQLINEIENVIQIRGIQLHAADDFHQKIENYLVEKENILLNIEYLTTFVVLESLDTATIEYLNKAGFEIFDSFIAKKGNCYSLRVPEIAVINSAYLKKVVHGLEETIIIDYGISYLRQSIFNLEILPSFYEDFFIRRQFLRPLFKPTLSEKISEAEAEIREFKLTTDLEFSNIMLEMSGMSSGVNSVFGHLKNVYSENKMVKWVLPDINNLIDEYDKLLHRLTNSINQTSNDLRTLRQREFELMAQNQQSIIILITLIIGFASILISIVLAH